jgi:hypothetical protein
MKPFINMVPAEEKVKAWDIFNRYYKLNDAVRFIGVKGQNDSLIYVNKSNYAFEIGSITKTFT